MRPFKLVSSLVLGLALVMPASASAETRVEADYNITVSGFRIGKLQLKGAYVDRAYTLRGQGRVTGIAGIFVDFNGETVSSGMIGRNGPAPRKHNITYNTSQINFVTDISFSGGKVESLKAEPQFKPREDRVAVTRSHMSGVVDPISALTVRVAGTDKDNDQRVCARTLRIFDGRERYDLPMTFSKVETVKTAEFSGEVVRCKVRYKPISGHRTSNDFVNDMATRDGIEASFTRVPGTDLFLFYGAFIPTGFGVVEVSPTRLNLSGEVRQAAN